MNILQRLLLMARVFLHDVFGEESAPVPAPAQSNMALGQVQIDALLAEARQRLEALRAELANATAREKRAELDWREAAAEAGQLDAEVDDALRDGREAVARAKATKLAQLKDRVRETAAHYEYNRQVTAQLQEAVATLQTRLEDVTRRQAELLDREQQAEMLEHLARLDRELERDRRLLSDGLSRREEQVTRREDRLAALKEWKQK